MVALQKYKNTSFLIPQNKRLGEFPDTKNALASFFHLAIPSIIELCFASLISAMDLMMVGNLGSYATSSVGLCTQPTFLALCFFFALNTGVTATVARRKGQNDRDGAVKALKQTLFVGFFISLFFTVLLLLAGRPLIKFAGAIPGETLDPATSYFKILSSFLVFRALMLTINAALRGVGETRTTLVTNVCSNVVNIILNYLLIEGHFGFPAMGVAGAALASGIGFVVGFLIALRSIMRKGSFLRISFHTSFVPTKETFAPILRISSNSLIEQLFIRVGFFVVAKLAAKLGTDEFSAHTILQQVISFTYNIGDGLGVATTTLVGQNLGKKRSDISEMYCKLSQRCAFVSATLTMAVIISCRHFIPTFFSDEVYVIRMVAMGLIPLSVMQFFQQHQVIFASTLRGAGDTRSVAISNAVGIGLIRPVSAIVSVLIFDNLVLLWSLMVLDMVFRYIFLRYRFSLERWKYIKV